MMRISCCNGEKITMSIAYLQKNIIFAVAILTRSRVTNRNLLIMRYIAHLLQSRIGGGKPLNSDFSAPKTATAITCGRTVLWMFSCFAPCSQPFPALTAMPPMTLFPPSTLRLPPRPLPSTTCCKARGRLRECWRNLFIADDVCQSLS